MKCFLLMDMPESCFGCNFMYCNEENDTETCQAAETAKDIDLTADRPNWCPLRELPEKRRTIGGEGENDKLMMNAGFNACLEEIMSSKQEDKC